MSLPTLFTPLVGLLHALAGVGWTPVLFVVYAVAGVAGVELTIHKQWYRLAGVPLSVMVWLEVSLFLPATMPLLQRYVVSCLIGFVLGFATGPMIVRLGRQEFLLTMRAVQLDVLQRVAAFQQEQIKQHLYEVPTDTDARDDDRHSLTML